MINNKPSLQEMHAVVREANDAHVMSTNWYRSKNISPTIKSSNCFLLIDAAADRHYVAHVLPVRYWDDLKVPISKIELIEDHLLSNWYKVETQQLRAVLNIKSK